MELEAVFDTFADATEAQLARMAEEIRSLRAEVQTRTAELQSRNGPPGEPGPAGRDGIDGKDGRDGKDGEPGPAGERGERGADGLAGRDGAIGPRGEQGERGADGIATLEELDARIEARFAELQVRTLADSWRGVWTPDVAYQRGNVAQWDGSPWLALRDSSAKPGTSPDWVLFAKKGRDGSKSDGRR